MESDSLCGHKERRAGKTMVHMTVFLVQIRHSGQIGVAHGIASLADRPHDATKQQGEQIGHLLH